MDGIQKKLQRLDAFQQRHALTAFPLAVLKKFGDDQAGYQAALITYYAFVSLFPLLMVAFSLLPLVLGDRPDLSDQVAKAVFDYFPVVGDDLQRNIHTLKAHGWALVIGLLFALYGARGIANVLQDVSNTIWQIPKNKRPGFPFNMLRSLGIIVVGGLGLIATTIILGIVAANSDWGWAGKLVAAAAALALNTVLFWGIARLATSPKVPDKALLVGAVTSACFWLILQVGGTTLLINQLRGSSALYGIFAVVLGLLFWLYLQAEAYVYALEVNVVKQKKLWPTALFGKEQKK
jgi:membrane protein